MFKNGLRKRAAIVGLVAWVTASGLAVAQSPAEVIYAGGDIVTINDKQPMAEAVAVKDGKIVAVDGESRQESGSTLQERPTLFGNWGGVRSELAEHGIGVSAYLTQFYGGLAAGDGNRHFEYGDKADLLMNINGEKIGLWKGFAIIIHGEYNFGKNANFRGGVVIPTNTAMLLPNNNSAGGDLTNVSFVQRFGKSTALVFGKINMVDAYSAGSWYSGGAGITAPDAGHSGDRNGDADGACGAVPWGKVRGALSRGSFDLDYALLGIGQYAELSSLGEMELFGLDSKTPLSAAERALGQAAGGFFHATRDVRAQPEERVLRHAKGLRDAPLLRAPGDARGGLHAVDGAGPHDLSPAGGGQQGAELSVRRDDGVPWFCIGRRYPSPETSGRPAADSDLPRDALRGEPLE